MKSDAVEKSPSPDDQFEVLSHARGSDAMTRGDHAPTATWKNLRLRANLMAKLRAFFKDRGFLEVETPILSAEAIVEEHINLFETRWTPDPRRPVEGKPLWLQSSPEAAMKRLMAAGGGAIYQVTRSFRNAERGPMHNPEFTIVEWYRRGDGMAEGIALLAELCSALLHSPTADRLSYDEAFRRHAGVDPHAATLDELRDALEKNGHSAFSCANGEYKATRDEWLNIILVRLVEPHLGRTAPVIVYDFPASQAALAVVRNGEPPLAERFELYYRGIELANGYHELLDTAMFRDRIRGANAARARDNRASIPEPARLIAAMESGLPSCSGTALGFDRLAMLAAGANTIDEVMAFSLERA